MTELSIQKNKFLSDNRIGLFLGVFFSVLYFFTFRFFAGDSSRYLAVAKSILTTGFPSLAGFNYNFHPPFFMYLIAFIDLIVHNVLFAGLLVVFFFSVGSLFFTYKISRLFFNRFYSILATILTAITPAFWLSATTVMQEIVLIFFYLATIYIVLTVQESFSNKKLILLAVILGFGLLTKVSMLILFLTTVAYLLPGFYKNNKFFGFLKKAFLIIFIPLFILGPYLLYNLVNKLPPYLSSTLVQQVIVRNGIGLNFFERVLFIISNFSELINPVLGVLMLIGLFGLFKQNQFKRFSFVLLLIASTFLITAVSSYFEMRFVYQLIPLLIFLSVFGFTYLLSFLGNKLNMTLQTVISLGLIVLVLLSLFPLVFIQTERIENWAVWTEIGVLTNHQPFGLNLVPLSAVFALTNELGISVDDSLDSNLLISHFFGMRNLGVQYALVSNQQLSYFDTNSIQVVKNFLDCNCSVIKFNYVSKWPFSISIVDELDQPVSQVFAEVIFSGSNKSYAQLKEFKSPFVVIQVEGYASRGSDVTKYTNPYDIDPITNKYVVDPATNTVVLSPDKIFHLHTLSDDNGIINLIDRYGARFPNQTSDTIVNFPKGVLFISKFCYEPQIIQIIVADVSGKIIVVACNADGGGSCTELSKITLKKTACWLNQMPAMSW
ncbi:MAG: glycosyltransferase family 39 protein [Candidatus Diapherotrites archaeon]|nr:glycosyltransferase family 39 protein [Candidatus Diapherotrites archaeon]